MRAEVVEDELLQLEQGIRKELVEVRLERGIHRERGRHRELVVAHLGQQQGIRIRADQVEVHRPGVGRQGSRVELVDSRRVRQQRIVVGEDNQGSRRHLDQEGSMTSWMEFLRFLVL